MKTKLYALFLSLILLGPVAAATGQQVMETYRLSFREAAEIIPLVYPHLSETARLSGMGQQLVLSGSPQDHARLEKLLSELDRPPVNLLISLRTGTQNDIQSQGGGVDGEIRPEGIGGRIRIYRSESAREADELRQLRVLEGRSARFDSRLYLPVTDQRAWRGRHSQGVARETRFLVLEEGFYVRPRIQGEQVLLDISAASREGLEQHEVLTQLRGPLGEWLPLAASTEDASINSQGLTVRSSDARTRAHQTWIKVDRLD